MRIGVLSDTHIPDRVAGLPTEVFELFQGVDMIIHTGDLCMPSVQQALQEIAPVTAVQGNRDSSELCRTLPEKTIINTAGWRIGVIHGTQPSSDERADRIRYLRGDYSFRDLRRYVQRAFAGTAVDCIIFGHSHQAWQDTQDGVLLFNPGGVAPSPGGQPSSVGILEIDSGGITGRVLRLSRPPQLLRLRDRLQHRLLRLAR